MWIAIAVVLAVPVGVMALGWWQRSREPELGAVSHQWIAEQRLSQGEDARR